MTDKDDVITAMLLDIGCTTITESLLAKVVIDWVFENYKLEEK